MTQRICAIILAAGASRRLGQPKQLLMYGEETLLARVTRLAKAADYAPIVVVLGSGHQRIRDAVDLSCANVVVNDRWEQGISTSIQAGLNAAQQMDPDLAAALILACDQPRLQAEHLRALGASLASQSQPKIAASSYAGVLGIPAIFPRVVFTQLHALRGDKGARALLVSPPCAVISVPFQGGEMDVDEPDDLRQIQ